MPTNDTSGPLFTASSRPQPALEECSGTFMPGRIMAASEIPSHGGRGEARSSSQAAVQVGASIPSQGGHGYSGPYPGTQPAPTQSEPDFRKEAISIWENAEGHFINSEMLSQFGERMYRLGSASRPKVEDADMADFIRRCRECDCGACDCKKAADLLERLARLRRQALDENARVRKARKAAEARAAKAEAELAKADAVAVKLRIGPPPSSDQQFWDKEYRAVYERHAAREQQKVT